MNIRVLYNGVNLLHALCKIAANGIDDYSNILSNLSLCLSLDKPYLQGIIISVELF